MDEENADDVVPAQYDISLDVDMFKWLFKGIVTASFFVHKHTRCISMNVADLSVTKAVCGHRTAKIYCDPLSELLVLKFDEFLQCGRHDVTISFHGELNSELCGFYRSQVTDDLGNITRIAATQFQPSNARRCFPCWDHPSRKAIFCLTIITSKEFVVLSNMPEESRTILAGGKVRVSFMPSMVMSTYVFGFAIGKFSSVEKMLPQRNLKIRVLGASCMPECGLFALDVATKFLAYFEDYFDISYPLPKLDLVALPELSPDAMEHWGLITFRDSALIVHPDRSSMSCRKSVLMIICHELVHQWFGNLVTLKYWTDLWLNEGFANFLMYQSAIACFPSLVDPTDFITRELIPALEVDALHSTYSLQSTESLSGEEVLEQFDEVSYSKGASLIRMLHDYVGNAVFKRCIVSYLKKFQFGTVTGADFWRTFSEVSDIHLDNTLKSWVSNPGYPVIRTTLENGRLYLKQDRFYADGSKGFDDQLWSVPITIATASQPDVIAKRFTLYSKEMSLSLSDLPLDQGFKLNVGSSGVYRVLYDEALLKSVMACANHFSVNDRIGLLNDQFQLARAGHVSTQSALEYSLSFIDETNVNFWRCFDSCLESASTLIVGMEGSVAAMNAFVEHVYGPHFLRLGWKRLKSESSNDTNLRLLVLPQLGLAGHSSVLRAARNRFWRHVHGKAVIQPDFRFTVYATVLSQGGLKELNAVLELFRQASLCEEKSRLISALAHVPSILLDRVFHFALVTPMRRQQRLEVLQACANTLEGRDLTWKFVCSRWSEMMALCDGLFGAGDFISGICFGLVGAKRIQEMEDFFSESGMLPNSIIVRKCLENVMATTVQQERDGPAVLEFFRRFQKSAHKRKSQSAEGK